MLFISPLKSETLIVVFEHNPPFQMIDDNGKGYGPVYDFAVKLLKFSQLKVKFSAEPWARIMQKESQLPNRLILSISKTPQRKERFIWLTSLYSGQQYIWKKRDAIDPTRIFVGMERNSHKARSIKEYFKPQNVFEFLNSANALEALIKGRVQRFVGTTFAVSGKLNSLGYQINELERLSLFNESGYESQGLYLALTHGTESEIKFALNKALKTPEILAVQKDLVQNFQLAEIGLLNDQN
nr:transporter substrate-binding domain-containing protein [Pseudoalteromonas denitrificans]